jgi:amino acid transporter
MAIDSAAASGAPAAPGVMDKGLKKGAIGYLSNIVIGVASTAPAYSLAATLGFIVAVKGVGVHAPAVLLVAFVPMLLVATAYKYFNRADPDAGTSFAWTTRTFGPSTGWLNGWAIFLSDVIVMASLPTSRPSTPSSSSASPNSADPKQRSSSPRSCGSRS